MRLVYVRFPTSGFGRRPEMDIGATSEAKAIVASLQGGNAMIARQVSAYGRRTAAATVLLFLLPHPALAAPDAWDVNESSSPLTHAVSISAALDSTKPLVNMIGRGENASLVLRCSDRVLVVYVNWPEVVNRDSENFAGQPKTMAAWRLDSAPIQTNFWTISDTGTAAGEFATQGAAKLLGSFVQARQLVVRLSGRMTQDAVFDLTGIAEIAPRVAGACGVSFGG